LGIGRLILAESIKWLSRNNFLSCSLEVCSENIPAQKLYRSLGFNEVGIRKNYYKNQKNTYDAILYLKEIQ